MGASGWSYFVPYQPAIQQALDDLRQDVFQRKAYYRAFNAVQILREPWTIEEAIAWNGEDGTHSILDVDRVVGSLPPKLDWSSYAIDPQAWQDTFLARLGTVSPLTTAQLLRIFWTTQPTHDLIVQRAANLWPLRDRDEGLYIIVYQDDLPIEIYFAGFSGD
jgi:hypothetical protein